MDVLYLGKSLDEYTIRELRQFLSEKEVSTVGRKKELVDRFRVALLKDALVQVRPLFVEK